MQIIRREKRERKNYVKPTQLKQINNNNNKKKKQQRAKWNVRRKNNNDSSATNKQANKKKTFINRALHSRFFRQEPMKNKNYFILFAYDWEVKKTLNWMKLKISIDSLASSLGFSSGCCAFSYREFFFSPCFVCVCFCCKLFVLLAFEFVNFFRFIASLSSTGSKSENDAIWLNWFFSFSYFFLSQFFL